MNFKITSFKAFRFGLMLLLAIAIYQSASLVAFAQKSIPNEQGKPFAVEYYYKVKWGHFDEFMELYTKNHYPILQRFKKMNRIVSMSAAYPINHAGEATRWDLRFTIIWKDAATAYEDFDRSAIVKELYPDEEKFQKEEQQRFKLLIEHMDVPIFMDDLEKWR